MRGFAANILSGAALATQLALSADVVAGSEHTYAPVSVDLTPVQVSEHVYYVQGLPGVATDYEGFVSNAGFVITGDGVVVFDALGTPALAWQLRERIRALTEQPVVKVVLSHYHADHAYGLQVFEQEGAEIIAPYGAQYYYDAPIAAERLEERRFSLDPWVNDQTRLVTPNRLIEQATSFRVGDLGFQLEYMGNAHSDGDLTMLVVEDRVLFSGDIIFEGRLPFIGNADTRRWLSALRAMESGDLAALIPGHGRALADPGAALRQTADYLSFLREQLGAAVDELTPFDEAYADIDWSRFADLPAFDAANRRNAYQVYLSLEAESVSNQ